MDLRRAIAAAVVAVTVLPGVASAADVHITIALRHVTKDGTRKLKVSGQLHDLGGGPACTNDRHVVVQRRKRAGADWNTLGGTDTNTNGAYAKVVGDRTGQYRVVAPATAACEKDVSGVVTHNH